MKLRIHAFVSSALLVFRPTSVITLVALVSLGGAALSCGTSGESTSTNASAPAGSLTAGVPDAVEAPLSTVVAEVNGQPLYSASYEQVLEFIRSRLSAGQDADTVQRFIEAKTDALDMLVNDELIHQEAKRMKIAPSTAELQSEFQKAAAAAGGEDVFLGGMRMRRLRRQDVFDTMSRKLAVDRFMNEKIVPLSAVADAEITKFYNENIERFTPQVWVKTYQILIRCPRQAPEDQAARARGRAEKILANIRAGDPFEMQAREYSEDSSAALSGNMGFMKRGVAPPEYDAVAFSMPAGRVSEVFRSDQGFHIVKMMERRGGEPSSLEKVREDVRKLLVTRNRASLLRSAVGKLRDVATITTNLE